MAAAVAVGGNENKKRKAVALYHCLSLFYAFYREWNSFDKTIFVTYTG